MHAHHLPELDIRSEPLRALYDYWLEKRGPRRIPSRKQIDPLDIPQLLSGLILMDADPATRRLKCRLVGTRVVEVYGSDYTGRFLDEIDFGDQRENVLTDYGQVVQTGMPNVRERFFYNSRGVHFRMERLILPLSEDDQNVSQVMSGLNFHALGR